MNRARWTTRALFTLLATLVVTAAVATGPGLVLPADAAASDTEATPLSVKLVAMSPSAIPRKGAITLAGTVTNSSADDWADVNIAPFVSQRPITTRSELALASATAASVAVGQRLTTAGTNVAVGDLPPGRSAPFELRVPVTALGITGDPGVYWIGVHALGTNADGRDLVADGRARTFIPLVTPARARAASVPVSVVLPFRQRVRRAPDGALNRPARWAQLTGTRGRLTRLVDFGASAGTTPLSWLVDPAVLDALDDFSRGNPPLTLASKDSTQGDKSGGGENGHKNGDKGNQKGASQPSQGASPSAAPSPEPGTPTQAERNSAGAVLSTFLATAKVPQHTLLTLGYADPDVASLTRRRPTLVKRADSLAAQRMKAWGLSGTPTVAPPDGYFDPGLLPEVSRDSQLLLGDRGNLTEPPLSRLSSGQDLVLSDDRAGAGGPAPGTSRDALALRQRILSEAALEVSKGGSEAPRPIVVTLPDGWDPGADWRRADFFGGLSTSWVRMSPAPRDATVLFTGQLPYGRSERAREVGDGNVAATRTLAHTSTVLGDLLTHANDAIDQITGASLAASSYSARATPRVAADQVLAQDANVRQEMGRVRVSGSDFVTLSGGSGSLTVTLVNGLAQPVTVGLRARADSPEVRVEAPDPVDMGPGQRTTLRLQVTSGVGVHDVTLSPVTSKGAAAGTPLTFSLRTSQVGRLIWYIIFAGGALLAVMIVRRIVLRISSHRWRQNGTS